MAAPADLRVLAFDVFGTLVDWRTGVGTELKAIASKHNLNVDAAGFADAWRRRAQELWAAVFQGDAPYVILDELHARAVRDLAKDFGLESLTENDRERLVLAWHHLPAWPDAVEGLTRVRKRYTLTTLSNGGMAHLVDIAKSTGLPFDCILSTELVKTYKPDPRVYQLVPTYLKVKPEQAMMVACHAPDLFAAKSNGLRTAFVRRPQEWGTGKVDEPGFAVDLIVDDFNGLASRLAS